MELKNGYKQSEVGVIPDDWDVVALSQLIASLNAGVSVNSVDEKLGIFGHSESVLKTSSIFGGYFYPDECKKIVPRDIKRAKLNPSKNSIIISRMNTPALVGECGYVDKDYAHLFLPDRLWQMVFKKDAGVSVRWLAYLLSYPQFSKAIKDTATGTSGSMKNISKGALLNIKVLNPSETEQIAIANALSDGDALIQSLSRLITKKRKIKQGAMQSLLNPYENGRLKEGWVVKKLGDSAVCLDNFRIPLNESQRNKMRGEIPYCGANGVLDYVNDYVIDDDVILMAEDGGYFDEYLNRPIAYRMLGKCWVNNHAHILKALPENDQGYLFYSLVHKNILNYLASGTRAKLNKSEMEKIEIQMPISKIQQESISTILSDMDADIASLEAKLDKTQQIKQGMMQSLLTGRVRLVQPETKEGPAA